MTLGCLALLFATEAIAGGRYPVKKEAVNPDYEDGQLWDQSYIEKGFDSYMSWCRTDRDELGMKAVIDYKSFEDGFDYEMTHKKKVGDRVGAITPVNACDRLCGFVSLDSGLGIDHFPSSQTKSVAEEFKQ